MFIKKTSFSISAEKCGFILFLILSNSLCFAAERVTVSAIFSSNIEPYQQSLKGFEKVFDEKKVALSVSRHNLEEENAEALYAQVKEEKPDIVLTMGTKASKLTKEKIKNTPAVFSMVLNPETIADSNIAGVSLDIPTAIKLKNLKKILPNTKSIGLIYSPQSDTLYKEISQACTNMGIRLVSKRIDSKRDFSDALEDISGQIDWFLMIPDTEIYFPKVVEYLLQASLKNEFPVVGLSSTYVRAGALISFDCDYEDLGRQTAELTLEILAGKKPVDTRVVKPRKVKISLNLLAAEMLDIKIPQETITQAGEVFGK